MTQRIFSLGEAVASAEVDLFGSIFTVRPMTASIESSFEIAENDYLTAIGDPDGASGKDVIAAVGAVLDIMLKPAEGGKRKPSKILTEKWVADAVALEDVLGLVGAITSPRPT